MVVLLGDALPILFVRPAVGACVFGILDAKDQPFLMWLLRLLESLLLLDIDAESVEELTAVVADTDLYAAVRVPLARVVKVKAVTLDGRIVETYLIEPDAIVAPGIERGRDRAGLTTMMTGKLESIRDCLDSLALVERIAPMAVTTTYIRVGREDQGEPVPAGRDRAGIRRVLLLTGGLLVVVWAQVVAGISQRLDLGIPSKRVLLFHQIPPRRCLVGRVPDPFERGSRIDHVIMELMRLFVLSRVWRH